MKLTCAQVREEATFAGAEERIAIDAHVASCSECAAALRFDAAIDELSGAELTFNAAPDFAARVREAVEREKPAPRFMIIRSRVFRAVSAAAMAAAVLGAVMIWNIDRPEPDPDREVIAELDALEQFALTQSRGDEALSPSDFVNVDTTPPVEALLRAAAAGGGF